MTKRKGKCKAKWGEAVMDRVQQEQTEESGGEGAALGQ